MYNNKRLYYKTRFIIISKNKQQNKKIDTKQKIYSIWPPFFFSIIVSTRIRNDSNVFKLFRRFIPLLLNNSQYSDMKLHLFCFLRPPPDIAKSRGLKSGFKCCLNSILTIFLVDFQYICVLFVYVVGSFLISVERERERDRERERERERAVKKPSFCFLFSPPLLLSLSSFSVNFFFFLYGGKRNFGLVSALSKS